MYSREARRPAGSARPPPVRCSRAVSYEFLAVRRDDVPCIPLPLLGYAGRCFANAMQCYAVAARRSALQCRAIAVHGYAPAMRCNAMPLRCACFIRRSVRLFLPRRCPALLVFVLKLLERCAE
jgi:hypothetical protein